MLAGLLPPAAERPGHSYQAALRPGRWPISSAMPRRATPRRARASTTSP
ncbi:hypothetical protein ACFQU7_14840 [Pseudoroseomonas wenyumeiae]